MSWTNEDVRDEIYEQDAEKEEGPMCIPQTLLLPRVVCTSSTE